MTQGRIVKRIKYLGLAVEEGTSDVPPDGRFHVTLNGQVQYSSKSEAIAVAHMEVLADEIRAANPDLVDRGEVLRAREAANRDYASIRAGTVARTRAKSQESGGKGGRGGV